MKLSYFVAECLHDNQCYNIRARTKKECERLKRESGRADTYGPVHRVDVVYADGFELMSLAMSEGRIYEGPDQGDD